MKQKTLWVVISECSVPFLYKQNKNVGILIFKKKKDAEEYVDYIYDMFNENSYIVPASLT